MKKAFWSVIGVWRIGRWIERRIREWNTLIKQERHAPHGLPLRRRLWALRKGFYSSRLVFFGLTPENVHNYVPDLRYEALHPLNGPFSALIDGKFPLQFTLKDFPEHLPELFYLVRGGMAFGLTASLPCCQRYDPGLIMELLESRQRLFVKPESGSGGHGVYLLEKRSGDWFVNGRKSSEPIVRDILKTKTTDHLFSESVEQHSYAQRLFPGSANTIRLISIRQDEQLEPVFIAAFHRVGTSVSQPADNLDSGGMFGRIDLKSGELGQFACYPRGPVMEWHLHHPETGEPLAGVMIPRWTEIRDRVLQISRKLPFMSIMGYDVVVTEKGFKILEINSLPTVLFQTWEPALLNKDAAEFFLTHIPKLRKRLPRNRGCLPTGAGTGANHRIAASSKIR